jgi:hypothetical protein
MIYEYKYIDTGEVVESDSYGLKTINSRPVKRIYSTSFSLKGGGWHHTEYPGKGKTRIRMEGGLNHTPES